MCENESHWGRSKWYVSLKEAENRKFSQCVNENEGQNSVDSTSENETQRQSRLIKTHYYVECC